MRKRILSILLTLCLCLSMLPAGAWAAEPDNDGLCPHHEEHNEACGYIEADEGAPCSHEHTEDCFAPVENCVHEHDEACGYAEPVEGVPCGFVCEICGETKEEEIEVYSEAEPDAMAVEADKLTVYDLDGDGTAENPYKISSREDLETIAVAVNGGNDLHGVYFEQTKDIDLEGDPWTVIGYVIGNTPHPFNGVYDGGNFKISGLFVGTTDEDGDPVGTLNEDAGLFGHVGEKGVIRRVHVVDCKVYSKALYVGGIAGRNEGLVEYCSSDASSPVTSSGTASGVVSGSWQYAGGIVGYNFGTIRYCYSNCDVYGAQKVGGITGGQNGGTVVNCYFRGYVYASDITRAYAGGIAGENDGDSTIDNCYSDGIVEGYNDNAYCGAIAGSNDTGSTVGNCFWEDSDNMGLPGIGSGMGDVENVEQRTEDEFASGQVAWELAHGTDGGGWGQNLAGDEIDKHPHFTDAPDKELPTTPVYRVTLKAPSKGINETIYVDPETDINLEQDRYKLEYPAKWYVVDENGDGVLDDEGLPMEFNGDVTNHDVDAVGGERIFFAGENETVTVTGTYNPVEPTLTLDLDGYMKYAEGGPSAAGRFEYEITGGNETLNAELGEDGNTLTIPESTDVGVYTLTVNAHEKKPFIAPLALGAFDTKDVLLTFNVEIIKANPVIVIKPKASDVVDYGSVLSDSKLTDGEARHPTAGTVVEGIFTWTSGDTKPTVNEAAITGYPVTFIPTDTKNYNNASAYVTLTVNKVDPEHVKPPKPINSTYNGMAEALIEAGYADGGVMKYWLTDDSEAVPDENAEFSYTIPSRANAGTYYIWYKVIGDENHNDTEPKRVEATISPCELKIPAQRVAYNGRNTFTLALEGVKVDGEDSSRTVIATLIAESKDTGNYAYAEKAGEGKYTVTISNSNYIVDAKNAGTLTIDPLPVVLQWEGPLTFAFKENVTHKVTAKVTNGIEGDTFTLAYKNNTNVNVGNYTAQVIDLGNENYTLENGQNVTQKWYILKELKDIKFNPPDHITYGEPLTLKVEITEKFGLENTDKVRFYIGNRKEDVLIDLKTGVATWVIPDAESEHGFSVGRIAVYAEYLGNENEEVVESFASTITVEPKTITATIKGDNTTKTYDKNMIATGLELDFGPDGVEDCDIGNVTVSADSYTYNSYLVTDANTITANHVTLSGVQSGNYTVEVQSIDGKIEPKVVKLEWRGVSDRVYDGNPSNVTATATELIPGDDDECFVEVSGGSEINAGGPYTAKAEKLSDPNYVLPGDGTTTVTYQIDPAPLYIPEKTVKYNRKSEFDVELYGVTLADGTPEIVPAKLFTSSADVGSYDYAGEEAGSRSTASEDSRYTAREDSQNYRIANGATLTIEKVDPTYIPPVAKKLKYNGSAQELVEAGSTEDGTMEYSLSADGPWYVDLPAGIEIGTYVVWYRVVGDKNHNDSVPQFVEATIDKEAPSSDPIDPDPTDPKKPSKTKKPGNTTDTSNPTDSSNPDNMISPGDTTKNPDSTQSLGSLLKTGDEMNIALWVILLLLSLAGIMVALLYEKKIKLFSSKDRCMK